MIFVHGMHSNFYRSAFKKQFMRDGPRRGVDVLSFNNRGAERDTETERFRDSVDDIDAAVLFGKSKGYRRFVLVGHSTGCQKIAHWQYVRKSRAVTALVLAAIGDDYAITRRELGKKYFQRLKKARRLVSKSWKNRAMPADCKGFTASRWLSIADPKQLEARLFDFSGRMREFAKITCPILALFPAEEQYACIPVQEMAEVLRKKTRSRRFESIIVPRADHSFRGAEKEAARSVLLWLAGCSPDR
jgi:pimeloyl-ACP methyl ester carboxylesterase